MEKIEIIFKFLRQIAWMFIFEGVAAIVLGVLIFIFPELLAILVAAILITTGIVSIIVAIKAFTHSKIKVGF